MTDEIRKLEERLKKASGEINSSEEKSLGKKKKAFSKSEFVKLANEVRNVFSKEQHGNPRFDLK